MSSHPLTLAAVGVVILTVAQGCTLPGVQIFNQPTASLGLLKYDPAVKDDFAGRFGAINSVEGSGDLLKTGFSRLMQFENDSLFALSSNGTVFNTANGGRSWQQLNVPDSANVQSIDYSRDDDEKLLIGGSVGNIARIYLSTNRSQLVQVYTEVASGTSIPFLILSKKDNSFIWAVVRSNNGYQVIISRDSGASWQKETKLPSPIKSTSEFNGLHTLLLANNTIWQQNPDNTSIPSFTPQDIPADLKSSTVRKVVNSKDYRFYITQNTLYRESNEKTLAKLTLPITDSTIQDVGVNPTSSNEYLVSVGKNLLQTNNGGSTWIVRNDVGNEQGAGRITTLLYDKFTQNQVYIGRDK